MKWRSVVPYLAISGSGAGFLLLRDLWQDSDAFSEGLNSRRHAGANYSWYKSDGYLDGISESSIQMFDVMLAMVCYGLLAWQPAFQPKT